LTTKGEKTRRRIVERAAGVFNTKGYFASKEELALEAFDYAVGTMQERFQAALEGKEEALESLFAIVDVLGGLAEDPPVAGGCPVLNTAVESDDAHMELKDRAREAMNGWLRLIGSIIKEGVRNGELRPGTDARETASVVVATLEGAVMLSRLYDDPAYMNRSVGHLKEHLRSLARDPERSDT
jgi:TetR/AcrR family transcriptional regulator, transcriptional repressor for nem operon